MSIGDAAISPRVLSMPLREAISDALRDSAIDPRNPKPLFELARRVNHYWHLGRGQRGLMHELNNPLAALMTNLGTLSVGGESEALDAEARLEMIRSCATLESLLRTASEAADTWRGVATILDLDECVQTSLTLARSALKYRMEVRVAEGAPLHVRARPEVVSQTLLNVLLNASRAQTTWGVLEVRTLGANGCAGIEIADSGPGFPAEYLTVPPTPLRCGWPDADGLGLGLFVSDVLLRGDGGTLERVNRPGGGAVVTILLPDGTGVSAARN